MNIHKADVPVSESEAASLFLLEQVMEYTYPAALRAAAVLGVADHLADGPKKADELAKATGVDSLRLYRLLRVLATRGIFREEEDRRFALTPPAEFLRSDVDLSLRQAVLMLTDETLWRPIGNLAGIAKAADKNPVFREIFGMPFFDYWASQGASAKDFHAGMMSMSEVENQFLVRSYDFPEGATVVDIAGGLGGLLLRVLRENPSVHGKLFDRPHVLERNRLGELGADDRWELVAGDFFKACPSGDVYTLKYIMHDWSDEDATRILSNCRAAMNPGGRVLIMDPVLPAGNTPHPGKHMDIITMGVYDGGRERTEEELGRLLAGAGLRLNRIINTGCYVSVVEGVAA
ncbi:methyltransferase [Nitratireductor sp. GCM10026969]|uniref:methyltransferase n=1 Tax=Nitratireductor sp. GCM10026969 TaxID=3252645 RepID=UPI0036222AF5